MTFGGFGVFCKDLQNVDLMLSKVDKKGRYLTLALTGLPTLRSLVGAMSTTYATQLVETSTWALGVVGQAFLEACRARKQ